MSLDVNVRALLDQMKAAALPKLWEIGPPAARAAMKSRLFRGKDTPIGKIEDRTIPGPGARHRVAHLHAARCERARCFRASSSFMAAVS